MQEIYGFHAVSATALISFALSDNLPDESPEFMIMEEVWNIDKRDLFVLKYYPSFADLMNKISQYFRIKRFNLDMRNYLLREVR